MKKNDVPRHLLEQVETELMSGEDLLWIGQPDPLAMIGRSNHRMGNKLVALGLIAFFGLLTLFMATTTAPVSPFLVIGFIVAMILLASAGSLFLNYRSAQKTIYAITNRRAIVIAGDTTQSFGPQELQHLKRRNRRQGRGDLIFTSEHTRRVIPTSTPVVQRETIEYGFFHVDNVAQVEAMLLETFQSTPERLLDRADELAYDDYDDDAAMRQQSSF